MTMQDSIAFLDLIKAYYPTSYRNFSPQEAKAVVVAWQDAFAALPLELMVSALQIHKDKSKFAPTIAEIREAIAEMHEAAGEFLAYPPFLARVAPQEIARRRRIYDLTKPYADAPSGGTYLPPASAAERRQLESIEF